MEHRRPCPIPADEATCTCMRLASLRLKGFRCFGPAPVTVEFDDLTALVGVNGSGKTTILMALTRMFGVSNTLRSLTKGDFHLAPDADTEPESLYLELEARFELPELLDDETALNSVAVPECLRHILADANDDAPQIRIRLRGTWTKSAAPDGEIDQRLEWIDSLEEMPPDEAVHLLSGVERSLIQVFYVPAARDAVHELRSVSGTILSRVLRHIEWPESVEERLLNLSEQMAQALRSEGAFTDLELTLQHRWHDLCGMAAGRPEISVAETDLSTVLRRIDARLVRSETTTQPLSLLSEGERSLLYFALVASSLEFESKYLARPESSHSKPVPALTLLAVEEPENHLAPQYLSRILRILRAVKDHRTAQVAITSHSASIVRRIDPTEIRHVRVATKAGHVISKITLPSDTDEAYKYVREAVRAHPELYFAQVIVLAEGPSEEVVLPRVAKAFGLDIDPRFVAVIPLGGRHVHHFWRLLRDLGTPFCTLLDLDMERAGGGWARIHDVSRELLAFGEDPKTVHGPLSSDEFDNMRNWEPVPLNDEKLQAQLQFLEREFKLYFSGPLDLDLLMLNAFPEQYEALAPKPGGPQPMPTDDEKRRARQKRLARSVLGDGGTDGSTAYSPSELTRFAWYSYLFVTGSKPVTHARMLAELEDDELRARCPSVLQRLIERGKELGV